MQKVHTIYFLYFTKPKTRKKRKKGFVDIGSESGYTNDRPTYVFLSVYMKLMKEL